MAHLHPGLVIGLLLPMASAFAQETRRVSVDSTGTEGNGESLAGGISADGRIVSFGSFANNLVTGDTNGCEDVFLFDRLLGATQRVSIDSNGVPGNGDSLADGLATSSDGRFIVFASHATNLVPNDNNLNVDIFVHDLVTGTTERVSVDSSGIETARRGQADSLDPSMSADGRFVAFKSNAANLIPHDLNMIDDVFVHDRATGITERVSVDSFVVEADGGSQLPSISADGRFVAFCSDATNLIVGDTNGTTDIFVHDRTTGVTERISVDSSGGAANGASRESSISSDGQFVAFASSASNLVGGDTNGTWDVFVHDRSSAITERISVDSSGAEAAGTSRFPSLSADGNRVAFSSDAPNLVAGDANGTFDAFFRDRANGMTERVSVDSSGAQGNDASETPSISADGRVVGFTSRASDLVAGDTNGVGDAFVHEFCDTAAGWLNYGSGFSGTHGVPAFTSRQAPVIGTTITVDVANSYAQPTLGFVFIGFQRASIATNRGGTILVSPSITLPVTFSFGGDSFMGSIPFDATLCGVTLDLQAIEADPGAAKGISFTQGLELTLGD